MSVKQEETQAQDAQFTLVFPSKTMDTRKTRQKDEDIYKKKLSLFIITTKSHHNGLRHHQPQPPAKHKLDMMHEKDNKTKVSKFIDNRYSAADKEY
jgi:hypothetical protein